MKKRRIFLILFSVFLFLSIGLSAKALGTITCNAYCTNGTYGYYTAGECSSNASCATYANQFGFSSWPFCTTALDSGECYYSCISKGTTACRGGQICYCANYAACAGCPAGKCTSSGCAASCPSSCTTYTQCQVCGLNRCWGSSASSYTCKSGCASNGYYAPASSECCSGTTWNSSTKICATTPVADTTPPTGTISASPNPATTAQTITVTISAYDAGGVNLIYINRQAAGWNLSQSCGGATSCTKTFSYSETTAGSYRYQGYIYDMAGNGAFALYGGSSNGVVVTVNAACACTQGSLASNNCTSCNYRTPYYYNCNCSTYAGSAYYDTSCSSACKPNGSTCSSGTECQSGYCVDGYCCNTSCTGTCYQCNKSIPLLGQNPGTCYPVEANYYPQHAGMTYACANAYSYCRTGYCDGSGGCQAASDDANCGSIYCGGLNTYYSSGKICYYRSYNYLTSNRCASLGTCKTANTTNCTSYSDSQTVNCSSVCQYLSGCSGTTAGTCVNYANGTSCGTGYTCQNGVCTQTQKPNGSTCSSGTECQSGYCVDGYCCNTSCTGTCYQCNKSIPLLGQNPGTCYPVEANYYPQHAGMTYACANAYSYCRTGYCDGSGGCQAASDDANCGTIYCSNLNYYYSSSKTCYLRSYTNLTSNRCAYLGACKTANSTYCTSYSDSQTVNCNADCQTLSGCSGTTAGTCVNIADGTACQTNKLCSNGVCVDKKTNGTACSSAGECQSGYCVDGYCCNSACTGTCQQCNMSYNLGNCSYVNSGYTPIHGSCVGTCRTGTCDGWGNCTKSPVGTSCGTGYACDANGDCTRIQNPNGTACSSSLECQSGNCIDGYCCNSSCGGTCQKCSLPGSVGICTYISNGEDPDDECSGSNSCNGTGGCTACSFLNPSTAVGKWQRVWRIHSTGACLGDGPDETSEQLDNNWGTGIIAYNRSDDIEMQSARIINISTPGTYRIGLGSDDGVKLYIDGGSTLSFAKWDDHAWPGSPEYMDVYLTAGNHTFELDYYDNSGDARLTFVYNLLFPVCSRANPVKSGNSWSITNDCWYKGNACYNDTSGTFCTDSCVSPAGEGIAEAENTITIPQGSWDMAITMNNISGLAKCLGDNCVFDVDCESSLASAGWTLYLDGEWLEEKQNGMSIIATGDGVQESSGSGNPISSTRQVNCTKPGGCALRIVKQFVYWVWARSSAFGGDKPAYAYGQLKADISVNLNEVSDNIPPTTAIVVKNALTGENMSLNPSKWYKPGSYTAYFTDNDNLGVSNLKSCQYKIASCSDAGNGTGCGTNIIPITDRACNGSVPVPIGSTAAINRDGWSALIYSIVTDNANNVTTTQHYLRPDINPPTTEIK